MQFFCLRFFLLPLSLMLSSMWLPRPQSPAQLTSRPESHFSQKPRDPSTSLRAGVEHPGSEIDEGSISNGVYRNKSLGFSCKIPAGWVLRTEEMNAREEDSDSRKDNTDHKGNVPPSPESAKEGRAALDRTAGGGCPHTSCGKVLLAAFSRPPEAAGEDVNSSILIAAESAAAYPGLTEAAQYLGPVEEVAKAQGLAVAQEPYEIAVGAKAMAREDFQKDVGSRVMRQSTLVILARGYAVSFTFIGGTEDEVEELVDGLSFGTGESGRKQ